ncbi:hypothetical protein M407DRAFT_243631 [Tulasnella calospora MUT 4182]|uniref:Uncharacterized protein n=1 Tax=Tulasnella calospora MUT 4182 TaxID=1051891 RepID=A0A0C3QK05_9AGAM|nr:hypothetical protein M407DRAFT_243631 [Tulasnella calospora MUT 4182]
MTASFNQKTAGLHWSGAKTCTLSPASGHRRFLPCGFCAFGADWRSARIGRRNSSLQRRLDRLENALVLNTIPIGLFLLQTITRLTSTFASQLNSLVLQG